ncbi:hypothetical protein [Plantibacter sp. YIM 135347]|uniref:hypothetical protein n=1 Tax=Plantibacter sp. YIM 135347 TaxID=3423919 RepID=UPI003D33A81B
MVGIAGASFESAWNASTTLERRRYQESWINGRDYIGKRCADSGFPIEFGGDDVPVQAPRVTEP